MRFLCLAAFVAILSACASSNEHCICPAAVSGQVRLVDDHGPVFADASQFLFKYASDEYVQFQCAESLRSDGTCSTFEIEQVFGAATLRAEVPGYAPTTFSVYVERGADCCGSPPHPFDVEVRLQKP